MSSEGLGLHLLNPKKDVFEKVIPPNADELTLEALGHTTDLELGIDGNVWVGSLEKGFSIVNVDDLSVKNYQDLEGKNGKIEHSLFCWTLERDHDGSMWIGTRGIGAFRVFLREDQIPFAVHYQANPSDPNSLINNEVYNVYIDYEKRIWIGNEIGGLYQFDRKNDNFHRYTHDKFNNKSISQNSIRTIYQDNQGRLWIGTSFQGVNVYDKNHSKFTHIRQEPNGVNQLSYNLVRDLYEDKTSGNIWIATDGGGLNLWNRKTNSFKVWMHDSEEAGSLKSDAVLGLVKAPDGKLWVTGWSAGINVLDYPHSINFKYYLDEGMNDFYQSSHFFKIIKDKKGNIWSANFGVGLMKFDWQSQKFILYKGDKNSPNGLDTNLLSIVMEDSRGMLWIGTENMGVFKVNISSQDSLVFEQVISSEETAVPLSSTQVNDLFEDQKGNIWVGSNRGLYKIDLENNFTQYATEHGMASDVMKSIEEDDQGKLWLGTNNGLIRFDPNNLDVRNYNRNDGLQSNEFTRYASAKLSTGELMFGGINGFNIFHPENIKENIYLPQVYISGFKIFNHAVTIEENGPIDKHISLEDHITMTHEQSVFSFEYTALNFTRSENCQFAFKMEGLENEWNYVCNRRNASYSNLDPGDYIFKVIASNNDGLWNSSGKSLLITILPPWWRTWWAKITWGILISLVIFTIIKVRTAYVEKQSKLLKNVVNERTVELKEKNQRIEIQSEKLRAFNESLNSLNESLEKTVEERTEELTQKHAKLTEYAFMNAHNLRVPVANIKGLIQLFSKDELTREEIFELIDLLKGQTEQLDQVLKDIQRMLEKDSDVGIISSQTTSSNQIKRKIAKVLTKHSN